ncbi:hypothetical protein [Methanothrix thermoacetophila]|uniref:Uncharacterized protein n=1 Tax=Methanothrix thermoacetophila (strain DSM 6194 / JCM 14653 / NBRC 101360 / PT) TaxID=349307 RepID=A0B9E2_METTP|nr:hypothetical protein [Methanothrix thermoacetophila]ABK15316.1 hypothetical protein Mthe_1545 [Methanothrix thermoacetophila PT]
MRIGFGFAIALLAFVASAGAADENRSWLADDMLETYHEGTLNFLGDPTGAGLSVYDNYVFYVKGSTYFRSKWKTPPNLPPDRSWAWGSGNVGGWAYTPEGTFIRFEMVSPPSYVYIGGTPVPYTTYTSAPFYTESNHLYIHGTDSLTRYLKAPAGSSVWLLAYTKTAGMADVYKVSPDLKVSKNSVVMPAGYSHMSLNITDAGRYLISFVKDSIPSETVVIDAIPAGVTLS